MKKAVAFCVILALIFSLTACSGQTTAVLDNSDNSKFIDFYTEGNYVYIECELNIYAEKDETVKISAISHENVETGLLKNEILIAVDKENGSQEFNIKQGENIVTVLFKGEYAGIYQISERAIPRFITIEKV